MYAAWRACLAFRFDPADAPAGARRKAVDQSSALCRILCWWYHAALFAGTATGNRCSVMSDRDDAGEVSRLTGERLRRTVWGATTREAYRTLVGPKRKNS